MFETALLMIFLVPLFMTWTHLASNPSILPSFHTSICDHNPAATSATDRQLLSLQLSTHLTSFTHARRTSPTPGLPLPSPLRLLPLQPPPPTPRLLLALSLNSATRK